MSQPGFVWLNGELVEYEAAKISVDSKISFGICERMRSYPCAEILKENTLLLKFDDHVDNFFNSAKALGLAVDKRIKKDDLREAVLATIRANEFRTYADISVFAWPSFTGDVPDVAIVVKSYESIVSSDDFEKGWKFGIVALKTQLFDSLLKARVPAGYVNDVLGAWEAKAKGLCGSLFVDSQGSVFGGNYTFLAVVKNGAIVIQPFPVGMKDTIRAAVITIAKDQGISVAERNIAKAELLDADEAFVCGVDVEIVPIAEVDGKAIGGGKLGSITEQIAKRFNDATTARSDKYLDWLTTVYAE